MNQYNVKIINEKDINWDKIDELTIDNYRGMKNFHLPSQIWKIDS